MNESKIALILGGTGGIGSEITKYLVTQGIIVYVTYLLEESNKARKIEKELKNCKAIKCDITKVQDIHKLIRLILDNNATIDVVVNAVTSKLKLKPFDNLTINDFKEDLEIITIGSINIYKQIVPIMKKNNRGLIITILTESIIGNPPQRMSSYVTSKSALLGLTRSLAVELKRYNIQIVNISPSFVETKLIEAFPDKLIEIEREKQPDKKLIQPLDIAELISDIIYHPLKYNSGENIILKTRQDIKQRL